MFFRVALMPILAHNKTVLCKFCKSEMRVTVIPYLLLVLRVFSNGKEKCGTLPDNHTINYHFARELTKEDLHSREFPAPVS